MKSVSTDQLDIFSLNFEELTNGISKENKSETVIETVIEEPIQLADTDKVIEEPVQMNDTIETPLEAVEGPIFRPFSTVLLDDRVKVTQPVDNNPDSEGYFEYHKGKKGRVTKVQELKNAISDKYQFCITVLFNDGETGIFYDLELEVIE